MDATRLVGIALGGALGALLRAQVLRLGRFSRAQADGASARLYPALATLIANTTGCLVLGDWLAGAPEAVSGAAWTGDFVVIGLCGGLTTFSTLCGDAIRMARREGRGIAAGYVAATFIFGTGGLWLGLGRPHL